eukprot:384993_1
MSLKQSKEDNKASDKSAPFGILYDILAQVISILDVTTDVIVCIQYYQNDRMIFFGISLAILCLACIAYDITFTGTYCDETKICKKIAFFLVVLPISPFVPFLMFFTSDPTSALSKYLNNQCCFNMYFGDRVSTDENSSKLRQFMEAKIMKHIGFIVEAFVEAFPQAVLQMTSIVVYNEANILSIISILISLLSVASKSFVFSIATAITLKQLWFNWLSAVSDFFGLFFTVSWVFYKPENAALESVFIIIQSIWLYRLFICNIPMVFSASIIGHVVMMEEFAPSCTDCQCDNGIHRCKYFITFVFVTIMWCCGLIAAILVSEMLSWTWLAGTLWWLGTKRYPTNNVASEFIFTVIGWINAAQKHHVGSVYKGFTSYTRKQDRIMRLCSLNYVAATSRTSMTFSDPILSQYLQQQRKTQYMNVTMQDLRTHSIRKKHSQFLRKFWQWYGEIWDSVWDQFKREYRSFRRHGDNCGSCCEEVFYVAISGPITFVGGPIYFLSRILNLFFPLWIILYLYFGYNINIWNTNEIHLFQVVMITIHIALCVLLSILFYWNCCEQYLMAHILPSSRRIHEINNVESQKELKLITNHYYGIVVIPIRRAMVMEKFGRDLGPIILSYLPEQDEYDASDNNVVRVKTI